MMLPRLDRVSVLIVDDNSHMRRLVWTILRSFGATNLREAGDGADALASIRSQVPDIVVTDWCMAPVDGLDLTRFIRRSPDSPNVFLPIIMMTGYATRSLVLQARDAGVTEFLVKPITAKALMARIAAVIENPRPFVRVGNYFGPDRRRRADPSFAGIDRRGHHDMVGSGMSQSEVDDLFHGDEEAPGDALHPPHLPQRAAATDSQSHYTDRT